jgi:GrpB-like predicted nucleotidyltransferase (UPF0157 family)
VHFRDPQSLRAEAERVFERERMRILTALPGAAVEHIGATSIPGAWSKGDVDLLVRVEPAGFAASVQALRSLYTEHQLENWNATFASFALPGEPVGAQLVATGSADERDFLRFRERLAHEPELLADYNELKRWHEGSDEDAYRAAKAAFVRRVVG